MQDLTRMNADPLIRVLKHNECPIGAANLRICFACVFVGAQERITTGCDNQSRRSHHAQSVGTEKRDHAKNDRHDHIDTRIANRWPESLGYAVKPAERVGLTFEEGLVPRIISDVHYQPGALPLLQYALTELSEHRDERTLTQAVYHMLGGAVGALAKRADDVYCEQEESGRDAIRQMFLRLVAIDEDAAETRRRALRSELFSIAADKDVMDEVIDTYAAYRLLTLDRDPATRKPTVELAHEAILREWRRLSSPPQPSVRTVGPR